MIANIPAELAMTSFSLVGLLTGYIWNDQAKRIKKLENQQSACPFPHFKADIAVIKTDILWIKQNIHNRR